MTSRIREFVATLTMALLASIGFAQDSSPPKSETGKPSTAPFSVTGFRYQLLSPSTHMNICMEPGCVPGSRVSYIFYAPDPNPSFERFKTDRVQVEEALRSRLPPGVTMTFDPPEETRDTVFTIFKARRTQTQGDEAFYVLSQHLHHKSMLVEIISSSTNAKAVDTNAGQFMLLIMLSMALQKQATP